MVSFNPTVVSNPDGTRTASWMGRNILINSKDTEITESLFKSAVTNWDKPENIKTRAEDSSGATINSGRSHFLKARQKEHLKINKAKAQGRVEYSQQLKAEGVTQSGGLFNGKSEYNKKMNNYNNIFK